MSPCKRKPPIVYRSNIARGAAAAKGKNNNNESKRRNSFIDEHDDSTFSSSSDDCDDAAFVGFKSFKDHIGMGKRLKKTLYYGRHPKTERPSLPMSELAVEIFSKAVPDSLGRIDMHFASSVGRSACISPCSMILAMAYLERLKHRNPEYLQQQVSSSDLFLVSMMVASKFLYDEGEDEEVFNDEWAVSASMDVKDLNQLERNFLTAIDWNAFVTRTTFERVLYETEYALALRKMDERGWSTYTEITILTEKLLFASCWKLVVDYAIKVIAVSAVAYTASVLTMIGATMIANQVRTQITVETPLCSRSNRTTETMTISDHFFFDVNDSDKDSNMVCNEKVFSKIEIRLDDLFNGLNLTTAEDDGVPFWFSPFRSKIHSKPNEKPVPSFDGTVSSLNDHIPFPNSSYWWPQRWPSCSSKRRIDEKTFCIATSYSFSPFVVAIS